VSVSAYLAPDANAQTVSADFASRMKSLTLPDGVSLRIGGETEDVDQSFRDMFRALLFGSALIFFILILLFRLYRVAFIVLSVVPLSLIGVIVGLLITGQPISFPSMLGFIALSGVVVNHAIILVDVFNRLRAEHPDMSLRRIVIEGGALRLRPILLTKITSIIGLVPLLFAGGIWQPIAVAMIFGLSFTGVITLIFIPVIYLKWCAKTHMGVEKEMV
jgi:HAE1 family hydrophobic/amphiphilic exporter-1